MCPKVRSMDIRVRTAGLTPEGMTISPTIHECGAIKDGVAIRLAALRGSWVISFEDLERVYLAAKSRRANGRASRTEEGKP